MEDLQKIKFLILFSSSTYVYKDVVNTVTPLYLLIAVTSIFVINFHENPTINKDFPIYLVSKGGWVETPFKFLNISEN